MTSYNVQYALAWLNAAVGIVAGAISAGYLVISGHPAWLTPDVASTCAIIATITVGLAQILPPLTRTPAHRETQLLSATQGVLPNDLADKHPNLIPGAPPTRPLD